MRLRLALVLGWVAACAPAPEARAPEVVSGLSPSTYGVFTKRVKNEPEPNPPPTQLPASELPLFSEAVRPQPPKGVACAIYGRGSGRFASCGATSVEVTATQSSDVTTAVVELREAEFAWGFYPDRKKAWIFVDDGTFTVDAYADPKDARFALRREVGVIADHVWFKEGTTVRAMNADQRGVAVSIDDDVAGIAEIDARVPCDTLLFDHDRAPSAPFLGTSAAPSAPPDRVVYAAKEHLPLYIAPSGERIAALGAKEAPFSTALRVLEERGKWLRVAFETDSARFDVWAQESDVSDELALDMFGASSCCGAMGLDGMGARPSVVLETTRVIVGRSPFGSPTSSVSIRKGAEVDVVSVESGFAAIRPQAAVAVSPPEGASFWVPESMLVR
ncbi:MAG: hypothetical protein HOV80_10435 [Polyangiaceae bacterium]|nr:hypothetical protein [Polyangiaceae bacterium]